jgi:hypothetical protein
MLVIGRGQRRGALNSLDQHWDGHDDAGAATANGLYLPRLQVRERVVSSKLMRLQ